MEPQDYIKMSHLMGDEDIGRERLRSMVVLWRRIFSEVSRLLR
jgi:hypothetical protein